MARNRVLLAAGITAALVATTAAYAQSGSNTKPLITQRISDAQRTTLAGNVRPEATGANDRGPVADSTVFDHMLLQLHRSADQEQGVSALIDQLQTQGSPLYHQWLSPQEFGQRYGVSTSDLATITGWLTSHGFV